MTKKQKKKELERYKQAIELPYRCSLCSGQIYAVIDENKIAEYFFCIKCGYFWKKMPSIRTYYS